MLVLLMIELDEEFLAGDGQDMSQARTGGDCGEGMR
jgi:hypothetical protein